MGENKKDETPASRPAVDIEKGPPAAAAAPGDENRPLLPTDPAAASSQTKKKPERKSFIASIFTLVISIPAIIGA